MFNAIINAIAAIVMTVSGIQTEAIVPEVQVIETVVETETVEFVETVESDIIIETETVIENEPEAIETVEEATAENTIVAEIEIETENNEIPEIIEIPEEDVPTAEQPWPSLPCCTTVTFHDGMVTITNNHNGVNSEAHVTEADFYAGNFTLTLV